MIKKHILPALLAALLLLSMLPLSAAAAVASDLPQNMADSPILRALQYTGYDVQAQKDNGTLYRSGSYGSRTPASIRSKISYGTSCSGKETVADSSTATGKAPNIAKFKQSGLCCASFVTYYLCNYLPNIERADTQFILDAINATGRKSQSVFTWQTALNNLVSAGELEKIGTSSSNVDRKKLTPGDVIIFGNDSISHVHIAIYSGTYKGVDFCIHVGNENGPEIMPVAWMNTASAGDKGSYPVGYYHMPEDMIGSTGKIEVYKKDPAGKPLAGAYFTASSMTDSALKYTIGPTDDQGYAFAEEVKYSTYKIEETVFPQDYRSYGQTEWTVTLDKSTPNASVTVHAVNELIPGSCEITKYSEDGKTDGITFRIVGNGIDKTGTTSGSKVLFTDLKPGTYQISEIVADTYEPQVTKTVTVVSGQMAKVAFSNVLKKGDLTVTKSAEDGLEEGTRFRLHGITDCGLEINEYATVGSNGKAYFYDIPIGSRLTLEEVDVPDRYVCPDELFITIRWNEVTEVSVRNILKKWRAEVYKTDRELSVLGEEAYGKAQGDASLRSAVYGLYADGVLMNAYATDENGYFQTDYYPCAVNGNDVEYYLKELGSSEGYQLDPTKYIIDTAGEHYTVERNTAYVRVYEEVVKGKISLIKHADDGSTQIEHPEAGAIFEVFLQSAGSYENAKETERALLVTDEYGFAESDRWLPYGVYVCRQIKGQEGKELMPVFEIRICENGKTYRYLINNATFEAEIEIIKRDAETGKIIPAAGIGFKIRNTDTGKYVVQHIRYPAPMDIEVFYTTAEGRLMLPDTLPYGNYEVIEQVTCYGYVLDSTPIPFKVDGTTDMITVEKYNTAQKGTITIEKSGEVFSSVIEKNGVYQPVYERKGLAGAVYEIAALEDVITPDGTVRYTKGQIVDTVTTDENGTAVSRLLYLGRYVCREIKAPYGTVLNAEPVCVDLVYAGENVAVTTTAISFVNERQKLLLDLKKTMEADDIFHIGKGDEITRVRFGLYAAEDLVAADGKIIPKDALLETADCDKDGHLLFATDLPVGAKVYIKEKSTDCHYILSDDEYTLVFDYAGQNTVTVTVTINGGRPIENTLIRGSVVGKKIDEDGFAVGGALFGLFTADTEIFTEDTALFTCMSDADGVFHFEDIPYGNWLVREIKTPPAFVLNETAYTVTVDKDGDTVEIVAENKFIVGSVRTVKTDADIPGSTLPGAVFALYADVDGNGKFDAEIDLWVGDMTEGENGIHRMDGLRYGGYFLHEKTGIRGFLKDDGYYYFTITEDSEEVYIENRAGLGFINRPIKGSVTILKKDSDTGERISGVEFALYDPEGNEVARGITSASGELVFDGLRFGRYRLRELTPKEGYQPTGEVWDVEITEDGQIITIEVTNQKIPEEPHTPDSPLTGDTRHFRLWFALMALSLLALVGLGTIPQKARNNE